MRGRVTGIEEGAKNRGKDGAIAFATTPDSTRYRVEFQGPCRFYLDCVFAIG